MKYNLYIKFKIHGVNCIKLIANGNIQAILKRRLELCKQNNKTIDNYKVSPEYSI